MLKPGIMLMVAALLLAPRAATKTASAAGLRETLGAIVGRDAGLGAALHPTDYRTLDDRIAARELVEHTQLARLGALFTEKYRQSTEAMLTSGAVRVDAGQPGFAAVNAIWLRCLERFRIPPERVRLYIFGDLEAASFSWGLPLAQGDGIVGLSSRIVRLFMDGDEGLKLDPLELEFLMCRELAHLQSEHSVYQMLTYFAQSVQDKLSEPARGLLFLIPFQFGLSPFLVVPGMSMLEPLETFLVSLPFRRFMVWDINALVSADRAALLALLADHSLDDALRAGTRVLLLGMMKDYHLVSHVDVGAFLTQVQTSTNLANLVHNPDRWTVDRETAGPLPAPTEATVRPAPPGLGEKVLDIARRLLGITGPPIPVQTAGYAELIADLANYRSSQELKDVLRLSRSPETFDRALLVLRRLADLDDIAHIRGGADRATPEAAQARELVSAMAADLSRELAAHPDTLAGTRVERLLTELPGLSYQCQIAAQRVLEELVAAGVPGSAPVRAAVTQSLVEVRLQNLLRTAGMYEDLANYLAVLRTPGSVVRSYLDYFETREQALIAAEADALATQVDPAKLVPWLTAHVPMVQPPPLAAAFGALHRETAKLLRAAGQRRLSEQVMQHALDHQLPN